ncbi:hypothetical protein [Methylocystis sp.]|uniref:hypothetical protein n=1 Tax=Methylocystis sp. TaxID=1911079 RepID=UPI003DA2B3E8
MEPTRIGVTALMVEFHQPHSTIKGWLDEAQIPRAHDKSYPADEARAAIKLRIDEESTLRDRYDSTSAKQADDDARRALIQAKREIAEEHARKLRLQNQKLENSLLDRETVAATVADLIARAKVAFLAVGPKVAPRLAGETDPKKIVAAIDDECRAALAALADLDAFAMEE